MKKTLAWLLTLFMVLTVSSVTVFAAGTDVAKIGETGYATLQAAIDVAVDGDEIVLLGNVSEDNVAIDKDITLDLATKILTAHVTVNGGADVTIKNGTVTVAGNDPAPGASVITVVDGELDDGNGGKTVIPSSLSLNGVTVHGGEAINSRYYTNAVTYNAAGGLTITGCTITGGTATRTAACASIGSNSSTAYGLYMPNKSGGTVTISGSTITGGYGKTDAEWTGYVSQLFSPGGCGISLHGTTVVTISDSTVTGGGSNWYNAETAINVSNQFSGTLAVIDSTVTGGTAEGLAGNYGTGGVGVYTHNSTGCEEIVISGSTITGGAGGKSFNGSGIEYRNEDVKMTITDSTVAAGNGANASGNGAAISIYDTATSLELDDVKLNGAGNGSNTAIKGSANGITASGPVEIIGGSANIEGGTWSSVTVSDAASINVTAGTIGSLEVEGDASDMTLGAGATVGSVSVGDKDYFVDSNGNLKEANTVTVCYTSTVDFWGEASSNSKESFIVELYEGDVKIASATLNNIDGIIDGNVYVTWHIPFAGSNDPYWTVEWTAGYPKYDMNPDKVVLVVDGVPSATNVVQYNGPDSIGTIVALAEGFTGGVQGYTSLVDAMGDFNGRKVNVLCDVTEDIQSMKGCTLTTNVEGGVTVNTTYTGYIYANDLAIGNGVTVKSTSFFYETDGVNTIEGVLEVSGTFYHGYNAKTTVQNGGSVKVGGTTILRYNTEADAGIYIYGDGNDSTVEFDCDYYIGAYSGTFYAENANIETGYFLLKNSYDNDTYADIGLTLDNSTLTVVGTTDTQDSFHIDDKASLTLKNGSAIADVRDFNILEGAQLKLSVDATSSISATNVSVAEDVPFEFEKNADGTVSFTRVLEGAGTVDAPYTIGSVDDLTVFAELVNSGDDFAGKTVQLTADIDLAGIEWTPIGNSTKQFKGYFDGNNKTISNLTVTGKNDYAGLFGYIKGNSMAATATPTVKNLNLTGVNVSGDYYVGALSGQGYTCSVVNVHVQGTVTGTRYVGGLIGHVYTYFKDCSFTGNASCTFDALGGIAGAGDCRAYDCKVVGDITGSNWVGGIVGNGQEGTSAVGCYVKGTVSTDSNWYRGVGGIAGVAGHGYSGSEFKNNYFDGEVYLCGEKVDAIIMGIVNADNNDSIGTTVEGNSWNTEYYPATTPVYVVAEISSSTATAEEWIAGASEEKSDVRNNNLVMLESDLAYVDAEDADDVTIMQFSDVTKAEVAHAVIVNKSVASITDSNGVTTYYDTLAEAMAAVGAGNVVIELTDDATLSYPARSAFGAADTTSITINGNGHTLTLHQTDTDWSSIGMANANGKLVLNNMTINKTSAGGNGAWNNHAINFHCDVEMNNVTVNNSVAVHAAAVLNNVDIVENGEYYGLWITADGQTVTMNGGSITATNGGRGIKIADQYVDAVESVTLKVTGTTFTTAKKAAILVTSTEGAAITVSNIDISGVAQDKIHAVWMDEARGEHFDKVTVVGGNVLQEGEFACIVIKNDAILGYYKTLEAAFADASDDDTVVLLDNVNAAVTYAVNKTLTLDLSGYTIESDAAATLTATAGKLTIVDSSADQTGAIIGAKAIHSSAYVAIQSGKFVGAITTANNEADDSQVCITGGIFTVEPNANLLEHCYISVENEDGTFSVIEDEYEVIINANGGVVTGAGFYKFGETVYIYADKNGNYTFAGWLSEDVEIMNPGERLASFVMPDHEVVVTAYWASNGTTTPVIPVMRGTIHFETNGGSAINSYTGTYGAKVDLAQFVTIRQGYTFAGWYSDAALSKPVTQLTLGGTKTVYAGWIETPVIPDVPVVVLPFTDVAADAYYYNAVLWAVGMGITNGISDTAFGPDMVCTRAQVVTFLWRAAGCPVAQNDDMPFADVTRDMYYYDAVLWAVEQGITNGISDTEFGPDAECSRAQIVTFLWRSQGSPAVEADGEFHDVDADAYYATAVEWAVDNGVTNGVGDDAFAPDAECTRAQTVTFLYRHFCK